MVWCLVVVGGVVAVVVCMVSVVVGVVVGVVGVARQGPVPPWQAGKTSFEHPAGERASGRHRCGKTNNNKITINNRN